MSAHHTQEMAQLDGMLESITNAKNVIVQAMINDCAPDPVLHPLKRLWYELSPTYRAKCEKSTRDYLEFIKDMQKMWTKEYVTEI